jgi:regulation of enolase protein 1 (concanavalin A-like superfamily)
VSGALTIPNTGGWAVWQTVSVSGITLAAGSVRLRIVADATGGGTCGTAVGNLNWFSLTQQTGGGGLPSPWHANDVGSVGQAGSSSYADGTFTVAGSGADIWGTADAFHFASQTVTGDTVIIARVVSEQNTNTFAKAGVMIRASLSANAAHVILDTRPDGSIEFMTRTSSGGTTSVVASASQAIPGWLSLVRIGSSVTAYRSNNGSTWTPLGSTTISLPNSTEVGLAVTSHDTMVTNTSTFDNVSVYSPWQQADVGQVGQAGSYSATNGTFTVVGSGADIWGTADGFHFVYVGNSDNVRIVARVTAVQNTSSFAKAGIMIRQSIAADAPHAMLDLTPQGSVEFMTRSSSGGTTTFLGGTTLPTPGWLRLTRTGNSVAAEVSSNGTGWTSLGSTTLSLSGVPFIGLVVSSHDNGTSNTSVFDSVSVSEP